MVDKQLVWRVQWTKPRANHALPDNMTTRHRIQNYALIVPAAKFLRVEQENVCHATWVV